MSAAQATVDREQDLAQRDPARGRLLSLVRALIEYGQDLVASLQGLDDDTPPPRIARRFGGVTLTLIIARITRGLMIAAALERRLRHPRPRGAAQSQSQSRSGALPDAGPAVPAPPRPPRAPRRPQPDEEAELLGALPSARDIAARIRNRRTGAVLVEICRDLGITTEHPLWREINDAIRDHGGNLLNLMRAWWRRHEQVVDLPLPPDKQARYEQVMALLGQPP